MIPKPTFVEEIIAWKNNFEYVIGLDEVGRGAFAGPVVVGGVIYKKDQVLNIPFLSEIHDSKLLSSKKREQLTPLILDNAFYATTEEVTVPVINSIGIGKATELAFMNLLKKVIQSIQTKKLYVLIDGFVLPVFDVLDNNYQKAIVKGDQKSISIASASIIAKVYRDNQMNTYHNTYPVYDFAINKGYGTKKHREAIKQYNLCELHRTSFKLSKFL